MTAIEYLEQIKKIKRVIANNQRKMAELEAIATSMTVATDNERVKSSTSTNKIENAVVKIVELQETIAENIVDFVNLQRKIIRDLEKLKDADQYQVLYYRFVDELTFPVIAERMHYAERTIFDKYRAGIENFEEIYYETH